MHIIFSGLLKSRIVLDSSMMGTGIKYIIMTGEPYRPPEKKTALTVFEQSTKTQKIREKSVGTSCYSITKILVLSEQHSRDTQFQIWQRSKIYKAPNQK